MSRRPGGENGQWLSLVHRAVAGFLVIPLALPAVSQAATFTWDANGATTGVTDGAGAWLDANQWWDGTSNVTWNSGDDAVFGVGGTGGAVTLSSTTAAGSLTFNPFSGTYTIGTAGQTLTLDSGGLTMNAGAGAVTLASPVTLSAPQSWTNNSSRLLTASGAITNGGNLLTVAGSGSTTLSAAISGAGGLTKNGSGLLLVSASNAYTGAVTINAGTLRVGNAWALGAISGAATVNAGGTLDINGNDLGGGSAATGKTVVLAGGTLVNNGVERQHAIKTLVVTADSTIGGSGRWDIRNAGATLTVNAGLRLTKVGSNTVLLGVSSSQIINNGEIVLNDGALGMLDAIISGTGSFTVNNGKVFDIQSGSNTLAMTLNSGQLKIGGVPGGRQAGPLTIVASTTNTLNSSNNGITISGNLLGGGRLDIVQSAGTSTILSGSNSGFTGTLGISNSVGSVLFASVNATSGSAAYILSGTNGGARAAANTVSGTVTHQLGSLSGTAGRLDNFAAGSSVTYVIGGLNTTTSYAGLILNTSGTTAVTKEGTGTLTLSGSNSYSGPTTISAGVLALSGSGALPTTGGVVITGSGATFDISGASGNRTVGMLTGTVGSAVTLGANSLTLGDATSGTFAGLIAGTGGLVKQGAGLLVIAGTNTYSGGTVITGGTVRAGSATALGASSGALALNAGLLDLYGQNITVGMLSGSTGAAISSGIAGEARLIASSSSDSTFAGVISNGVGTVGFTKSGAGRLTLTGMSDYTGSTIIAGGTLALSGDAALAHSVYIKAGNVAGGGGVLDVTGLTGGMLTVANGQKLGGYGTVYGDVTIANGAVVAPGGSIGSLAIDGDTTWGGGGSYLFEVYDAGGSFGTGWDLLEISGGLTITSDVLNPFVINLQTLATASGTAPGAMPGGNWDANTSYAWKFAQAGSTISTFDPNKFTFVATNFQNEYGGSFSIARGDTVAGGTDNQLYIVYAAVPEPGSLALAGIGIASAAWALARKRRQAL